MLKLKMRCVGIFIVICALLMVVMVIISYETPVDGKPTVFVLAYHRSGSSFTGAVLAHYPGAFYVFEPLHAIKFQYKSGKYKYATFFNGTKVRVTDSFLEYLRHEELRALASCDFKRLPYERFLGFMHKMYNDSFASFSTCVRRNTTVEPLYCLDIVQKRCLAAPIRVMKFIRLRISQVEGFLELYPHLKFIHLVRDPRGNALSQWKKVSGNVSEIAARYCQTVRNDIQEKARIFEKYPDRIYTLKYENLATFPLKYATEMIQFINRGFSLTDSMKEYIKRIALSGKAKRCSHCVDRGNGSKMASKWRRSISTVSYKIINEVCADILDAFGYSREDIILSQ